MYGEAGEDKLFGDAGADSLFGGDGNDSSCTHRRFPAPEGRKNGEKSPRARYERGAILNWVAFQARNGFGFNSNGKCRIHVKTACLLSVVRLS